MSFEVLSRQAMGDHRQIKFLCDVEGREYRCLALYHEDGALIGLQIDGPDVQADLASVVKYLPSPRG